MVGRDRMGDVLQEHRFTGARRCDDESTLSLAERRNQIDHPRRDVLGRRIVDFHLEPLIGIQRRQIVKMNLVTDLFRDPRN
jgi:hypothetical protein